MLNSFYGWYMKCQSDSQMLAFIPAVHQTGRNRTASIQLITDNGSWTIPYYADDFSRHGKNITIEKNTFGKNGISLAICTPDLKAYGNLHFSALCPLKYDIMGPFALVPFMECRHSVISMKHNICGTVNINDQEYAFDNGTGYWEGDRGRSFPEEYAWTQCCFPGGSLMLSVADIPFAGFSFTGIIGSVLWKGHEYRLATYLGARLTQLHDGVIKVVQGKLELEVNLLESAGHPLKAPSNGDMIRTIHENLSCRASYCLKENGRVIFSFDTDQASFEYEYNR